jgi:XTP/dITP diphosphohydrolase
MQKLLIATTNPGKIKEMSIFLANLPVQLMSLKDVGIFQDIEETGKSYEENAQLKATIYARLSGLPAVSDDGGLEIAALDGAPGIKSRRWLGYEATDAELIAHLKKIAKTLPKDNRKATFKTVVSFALPIGAVWSTEGSIEGIIKEEPNIALLAGYPYRSFFFLPTLNKYYNESELTKKEMKAYNHRYKAIEKLKKIITKELKL